MDADDPVGMGPAQFAGDGRSPVAALRPERLIAEPPHQLGPRVRDPPRLPARVRSRPGQPEPRNARYDDVEGVGRIAAVGGRVRAKCTFAPSRVVVNCGRSFSSASAARQS